MSILLSKDRTELIATCNCGCNECIKIKLDPCWDEAECSEFAWMSFFSSTTAYDRHSLKEKLKRVWFVLRGKDYCYNDVILSIEDVKEVIKYLQNIIDKKESN